MTILAVSRAYYRAQKGFTADLDTAMQGMVSQISGILTRWAVVDGKINPAREQTVLREVDAVVIRFFVGVDLQAYADDGRTPQAEYPRILNKWLARVIFDVAQAHADILAKLPPDVLTWLKRYNPLAIEMVRGSSKRPLDSYIPPHEVIDGKDRRLSNRIWDTAATTRNRIDAYLVENIRKGTSALEMSRELEQFLLPSRKPLTTHRPYGTKASFDAMRLARTEITLAHSRASFVSALSNPFVETWDWALSAQHPKFDICDNLATIGMNGQRIKDAYPLSGWVPLPVVDSHPNCICVGRPGPLRPTSEVVDELRAMMGKGQPPPPTPADPRNWLIALIGLILANLVFREEV